MTSTVQNPILPGFNPDPSICRVGKDYYIATSTFEWYPGVQIHHSRDLVNWNLIARPLNREDLLDMRGNPDSCGVWAPCLSFHEGYFYLVYTDVKRFDGHYKDTHNYLTRCQHIDGEWEPPVYLNSSGFDPSIFHAEDGRQYICNMVWDHRSSEQFFGGIVLQEYSAEQQKLIGPSKLIFAGSELGRTEAPHLYWRDGYYYLITAEGGTGYEHAVTMARSKDLWGPYELDPIKHIVTSKDEPDYPLQKAGHADFVEDESGTPWLVHLASRPLPGTDRCPLGRETALQQMVWTDEGWLRKAEDGITPDLQTKIPYKAQQWKLRHYIYDWNSLKLPDDFQWLRTPDPDAIFSLRDRPGYLRLIGRESIGSWFTQSLVARRQQAFNCQVTTRLCFESDTFQHAAGLVSYYNTEKFHYLLIRHDEELGMCLEIMSCLADRDWMLEFADERVPLPARHCKEGIYLRLDIAGPTLKFSWSLDGIAWQGIGGTLDQSLLSDDCGTGANFTGSFVGMACQDTSGQAGHADFEFFEYLEQD
ncbi:MAG: glycoside hydrolase family 43 protein [Pseudomonadota bacterium]